MAAAKGTNVIEGCLGTASCSNLTCTQVNWVWWLVIVFRHHNLGRKDSGQPKGKQMREPRTMKGCKGRYEPGVNWLRDLEVVREENIQGGCNGLNPFGQRGPIGQISALEQGLPKKQIVSLTSGNPFSLMESLRVKWATFPSLTPCRGRPCAG